VIETRKRVLWDEHPDTLLIMGNLASTYRNQGRWQDTKQLEVQVMGPSRKQLGKEIQTRFSAWPIWHIRGVPRPQPRSCFTNGNMLPTAEPGSRAPTSRHIGVA
jgi:hypothetical protein